MVPAGQKKKWDKFEMDGVTPHVCHKQSSSNNNILMTYQKRL
jgi:hypothetical protein